MFWDWGYFGRGYLGRGYFGQGLFWRGVVLAGVILVWGCFGGGCFDRGYFKRVVLVGVISSRSPIIVMKSQFKKDPPALICRFLTEIFQSCLALN